MFGGQVRGILKEMPILKSIPTGCSASLLSRLGDGFELLSSPFPFHPALGTLE